MSDTVSPSLTYLWRHSFIIAANERSYPLFLDNNNNSRHSPLCVKLRIKDGLRYDDDSPGEVSKAPPPPSVVQQI